MTVFTFNPPLVAKMHLPLLLAPLAFGSTALSQAFISPPQGLEEVFSDKFPGANITYKQVNGICETTEGVRSFSGHVHLPKDFIPDSESWTADLDGHLFFWYFGKWDVTQAITS